MADAAGAAPGLPVAAAVGRERDRDKDDRRRSAARCGFAVLGIMGTLLVYGVLQEKIMRIPYGAEKEFFRYSLFLVFCNRITTSMVSAMVLLASKKSLDPVAPLHKYGVVSISNILTTTCQYEALKSVGSPYACLYATPGIYHFEHDGNTPVTFTPKSAVLKETVHDLE